MTAASLPALWINGQRQRPDAAGISAFDRGLTGKGLARAIQTALTQAGIQPQDIDHVNAHGLGSVAFTGHN